MAARVVAFRHVLAKDLAQVRLVDRDQVIAAVAADRADGMLGVRDLPGRLLRAQVTGAEGWRDGNGPLATRECLSALPMLELEADLPAHRLGRAHERAQRR